jgi:hypothetical protein
LRSGFRGAVPTSLARLFPGHPGLSWKRTTSILLAAARFVLSMNCEQHNKFFTSFNKLICTVCSPKMRREQPVKNSNQPVKSMLFPFHECELFTAFSGQKRLCEQI